jgi:hypothetical protein
MSCCPTCQADGAMWKAREAAMRNALEHCRHRPHEHNPGPEFTVTKCEVIDRALSLNAGSDFEQRIRADEREKLHSERAVHRIGWDDALEAAAAKIRALPRDDYSAPGMAEFVLLLKKGQP